MRSQRIELKLSKELLQRIDQVAAVNYENRSEFIRKSIALRLNNQTIVESQSEEDKWQALLDSTLSQPPEPIV
jgi:metal-responsive CopG/Arc/MetJ family transcriptional regulator